MAAVLASILLSTGVIVPDQECLTSCGGRTGTAHPECGSCTSYLVCHTTPMRIQCSPGQVYLPVSARCALGSESVCTPPVARMQKKFHLPSALAKMVLRILGFDLTATVGHHLSKMLGTDVCTSTLSEAVDSALGNT